MKTLTACIKAYILSRVSGLVRCWLLVGIIFVVNSSVCAAAGSTNSLATVNRMLEAIEHGSRPDFLRNCSPKMHLAVTDQIFKKVLATYGPLIKQPHSLKYFGDLNRDGNIVYIYRLRASGSPNDVLISLSEKDGVVSGFYLF